MPVLKDLRQTKTISLPSYPDSQVEIYDSVLIGDLSKVNFQNDNQMEMTIEALPRFIKSWNFTDDSGKTLEINRENLNFLSQEDAVFLLNSIQQFNKEIKKKLGDSPASPTS